MCENRNIIKQHFYFVLFCDARTAYAENPEKLAEFKSKILGKKRFPVFASKRNRNYREIRMAGFRSDKCICAQVALKNK